MPVCRCQKGLTVLDTIITLCFIGILIGVVIPKYQEVARAAQEEALRAELVNIRTGIELFKVRYGRAPASLQEMIEKKTLMPGRIGSTTPSWSFFDNRYLLKKAVNVEGAKLDAFGNPFTYNREKGEVKSTTEGYEAW